MCRELAARGVTLLEADTDGVYFAVPEEWGEADEQRVAAEVAALLPPLVQLESEGRYAAMLSHEPKNYALVGYDGSLLLRGVAFRSSRAERFGEAFLRRAIARLLLGDLGGVRDVYVTTLDRLRRRELPAYDVSSRVRLTKTPAQYLQTRDTRRELPYEAMLASGRTAWSVGDRIRVYRDLWISTSNFWRTTRLRPSGEIVAGSARATPCGVWTMAKFWKRLQRNTGSMFGLAMGTSVWKGHISFGSVSFRGQAVRRRAQPTGRDGTAQFPGDGGAGVRAPSGGRSGVPGRILRALGCIVQGQAPIAGIFRSTDGGAPWSRP
jgi:hypothetical protein